MWFIFIKACRFIFLSFPPRLAATQLRSCSVVNSPTRRAGLSPAFQPASLAQGLIGLIGQRQTPIEYIAPLNAGTRLE